MNDVTQLNPLEINIVLHRPIYPRNIGMCARAMGNLGAQQLIIVAPQCELTDEAKQGAAHAQDLLKNHKLYSDIDHFYENEKEGLRIALSGRDNKLKNPDELSITLNQIRESQDQFSHLKLHRRIYLFFGPEDDGLSAHEMSLCHHVCRLPTYGDILSYNLSHAVLLALYTVRTNLVAKISLTEEANATVDTVSKEAFFYPQRAIREWLLELGFNLDAKKVTIEKTLNRILLSQFPSQDELRLLNTVLQQTVRKLKERTQKRPVK